MPLTGAPKAVDKLAILKKAEIFGNLSDELLRKVSNLATSRQVKRGQVLFSEREEGSGLYVVARGELRSVRQDAEGHEQVLSTEHAGAVLALAPVFNGGKFYSTMVADTAAEVLCIQTRDVHELCQQHAELLWNVAKVMSHRVRHYAELIETLALHNVDQRLGKYLLAIAQERGLPVGSGRVVELTLTRGEIASRIGSAREVVSRALTHLQRSKLIEMTGRRLVTIPDMRRLAAFAGLERPHGEGKTPADLSSEFA
ncbi:MAG TPA: Crp/Fnr family transcriptional regulator [Bryobacteraceae bacterium]|nr:Crp/Fnr family transcriptional regulator [Bryobacteraceae bacterium]